MVAVALLAATSIATPGTAQQADTPAPTSGGFSLENIGRPTRDAPRPQVQGPVDPDAPIAPRPTARPTPAPTQGSNVTPQQTSPAPTITLSPPTSNHQSEQNAADPRRQTTTQATTRAAPPPVAGEALTTSQLPDRTGTVGPRTPSTALPTIRDPLADAPIVRPDGEPGGVPWAWLIAALALLGGLAYYLRSRNRGWQPTVGVPLNDAKPEADRDRRDVAVPDTPAAAPPAPRAVPPAEPLAPAAQTGEGIEVTFVPDYAAATFTRVAMRYVVTVRNSGSKLVKNLAIRTAMIPASAEQDQEVAAFMADDTRMISHHVETLGAGQSIDIEGEMALPLNQARAVRYGERLLFVPVAAFAIAFTRNRSARRLPLAYMVGVNSGGSQGKMGPLRLDLGPKTYNQVGQRPLALASAA